MFISKKELKEIRDSVRVLKQDIVGLYTIKADVGFKANDRLNGGTVNFGDRDLVIALLLEYLGLSVKYDRIQNKTSIVTIKELLKKEKKNGK